ncbi:MAG TPA: DUF6484 domain-containing protein [Rhizobacter sp.]|nr:DUF6484 domain-containing protein [Rhizobacter sp.]
MSRVFPKLVSPAPAPLAEPALQIGSLVGLDEHGRGLVRVGGREPVAARCTVARPAGLDATPNPSVPVLLFLEDGDAERPVIVGFVTDALAPPPTLLDMPLRPSGATLDGKRLLFEASQEVVLKCGKGSITLQANGRVVIKGTELVSRASGPNKIRGASVDIN